MTEVEMDRSIGLIALEGNTSVGADNTIRPYLTGFLTAFIYCNKNLNDQEFNEHLTNVINQPNQYVRKDYEIEVENKNNSINLDVRLRKN